MKLTKLFWLMLLVSTVVSTAVWVSAQDRDHDRDRGRRGGACFYKEANYEGDKFCLDDGERMAQLPQGFNDRISSIRIFGRTEIVIHQDENFRGASLRIRDDVPNLQAFQISPGHSWNDKISSIDAGPRDRGDWDRGQDHDRDRDDWDRDDWRRSRGGACFFKDADFRGEKFCVRRGEGITLVPEGFNDRISSIKIFGRTEVTVYRDEDYRGRNATFRDDIPNLKDRRVAPDHSWNDRISSIRVR